VTTSQLCLSGNQPDVLSGCPRLPKTAASQAVQDLGQASQAACTASQADLALSITSWAVTRMPGLLSIFAAAGIRDLRTLPLRLPLHLHFVQASQRQALPVCHLRAINPHVAVSLEAQGLAGVQIPRRAWLVSSVHVQCMTRLSPPCVPLQLCACPICSGASA